MDLRVRRMMQNHSSFALASQKNGSIVSMWPHKWTNRQNI